MTILPPKALADQIGLTSGGLVVLEHKTLWAHRDRYAYCVEALIEIEIAYDTADGYVILRHKALVNTEISRLGGTRARLLRAAALMTAMTHGPATQDATPVPLAA